MLNMSMMIMMKVLRIKIKKVIEMQNVKIPRVKVG